MASIKKAEMRLLKVTSMKSARVLWGPTRLLIILMQFDAVPSCDPGSYFGARSKRKKEERNQHRKPVNPSVISPSSQESY